MGYCYFETTGNMQNFYDDAAEVLGRISVIDEQSLYDIGDSVTSLIVGDTLDNLESISSSLLFSRNILRQSSYGFILSFLNMLKVFIRLYLPWSEEGKILNVVSSLGVLDYSFTDSEEPIPDILQEVVNVAGGDDFEYELEYNVYIPVFTESALTDSVTGALGNLLEYMNTQFGLDDLVKGEPYSLPPANAELASQAIVGGLVNFGVSQVIPLGTFALQVLEQIQTQKLNYVQDVQFQLIIAMFKVIVAGLWPKGDLSELLAAFSGLDTGSEYRAKINDHWLNQSLTRALNSFTDETEYPLDTPSVDKVVAEKTDLIGVQYGNFKKMFPFETVSGDIFYLTEEMTITPWPKQFFFIQE